MSTQTRKKKCPYCSRVCKIPNIVLVAACSSHAPAVAASTTSTTTTTVPAEKKSDARVQKLARRLQSLDDAAAVKQIEENTQPTVVSDLVGALSDDMLASLKNGAMFTGGHDLRKDALLLQASLERLDAVHRPLSIASAAKLGELLRVMLSKAESKSVAGKLRKLWKKLDPHSFDAWNKIEQLQAQAKVLQQTVLERDAEQAKVDAGVAESKRILKTLQEARLKAEQEIQNIEASKQKQATPEQVAQLRDLQAKLDESVRLHAACQTQTRKDAASYAEFCTACEGHEAKIEQLTQAAAGACDTHEEQLKQCATQNEDKDARIQALEAELAACAAKATVQQGQGQGKTAQQSALAAKDKEIAALKSEVEAFVQDQSLQNEIAELKQRLEACDAKSTEVMNADDLSTNTKYKAVEELEQEMAELRAKLEMCEGKYPESAEQRKNLCMSWFTAELNTYKTQWAEKYQQKVAETQAKEAQAEATVQSYNASKAAYDEAEGKLEEVYQAKNAETLVVKGKYDTALEENQAAAAALAKEKAVYKEQMDKEYGEAYAKYRGELLDSHEANVRAFEKQKAKEEQVLQARLKAHDAKLDELTSEQWHVDKVAELENAKQEAKAAADKARAAQKEHEANVQETAAAKAKMEAELAAKVQEATQEKTELARLKAEQQKLIAKQADEQFQATFEEKNKEALEAKRTACVDIEASVQAFKAQVAKIAKQYEETLVMKKATVVQLNDQVRKAVESIPKNSEGADVEGAERVKQLGEALQNARTTFIKDSKEWVKEPSEVLTKMIDDFAATVRAAEAKANDAMVAKPVEKPAVSGGSMKKKKSHRKTLLSYSRMFGGYR